MRFLRASVVVALSTIYFSYVFQFSNASSRTAGLGDWIDPYFINYLLEHWYHSLLTFTDPASPPMYFPARGTLGYSHGLILYAPFYVVVRPFLHPFQAYTVSLFLVMEAGGLCLYAVLRRFFRLRFLEGLLLTAFFVSSPNVVQASTGIWSQRASVFLIPIILLIVLTAVRLPPGRPKVMLAWLSGLLPALLFIQDFYTAQFTAIISMLILAGGLFLAPLRAAASPSALWNMVRSLFAGPVPPGRMPKPPSRWWLVIAGISLAAAIAIEVHPIERTSVAGWRVSADRPDRGVWVAVLAAGWFAVRRWQLVGRTVRAARRSGTGWAAFGTWLRGRPWLLTGALGGFTGIALFLWIYVGAHYEHPTFPEEMLTRSLTAFDASNVHHPSDALRSVVAYDSARSFTLVLLVGILSVVPWFRVDRTSRICAFWFLFVSAVVLLVPLRFGDFSVWKTFFRWMPGSWVIRDPRRIIEVYELAAVIMAGLLLSRLSKPSLFRHVISACVLLLLVTGWKADVFTYGRPNSVYQEWVEAPIQIDSPCRSFFIKGASPRYMARSGHMWSLYAIDAMFIAMKHSIPTMNGYSAWEPLDWGLANPQEASYPDRVARWIGSHDLHGVCALDIEARTMTPYQPVQPPR